MVEVAIRDYERMQNVGLVSDEGLRTDDQLLREEAARLTDMGESDYAVHVDLPGHRPGEYQSLVVEPGDTGYARALVDELPSPFDIADMSLLDELPLYRQEPFGEPDDDEDDESPSLSNEIAESAVSRLSRGAMGSGSAGVGGARHSPEDEEDDEVDKKQERSTSEIIGGIEESGIAFATEEELDQIVEERSSGRDEKAALKGSYAGYIEQQRVGVLEKAASGDADFATVDAELMKFYTHVVWYDVEKDPEDVDLEKAPEVWRSDDEIPEFVKEYVEAAIADGAFWQGNLKELPSGVEQQVRDLFEEKMTQPQGWSLGSIVDDLEEMFPGTDKEYLLTLTRNEVSAIANRAREEAYLETTPPDERFYWSGPQDFRTTDICENAKEMTNPRFGGEPMELEELRDALEGFARESEDGNLVRADDWMFHHKCRHSFIREVYL